MKPSHQRIWLALVVVATLFTGWRVVGQMQAERFAESEPERALRWRPDDPTALLALAERQLKQGNTEAAAATARHLLANEPLQGRGFRVLAQAAAREGRPAEALKLYEIAARRAPRDLATRAWLTQHYLEQGKYPQALAQIDRILRMEPQRARSINPVLVQLAQDPAFAAALADALRADPPWRTGTLAALRDIKTGNPEAAGRVLQALQDKGGLSDAEYKDWLDSLILQDRWGEAYARWAGAVAKPGGRLPLVYNGDFSVVPSEQGFDWRVRRVPGVLIAFEPVGGSQGPAAYMRFLDRRIPAAGLEQPLLLAPGRYLLTMRMRAEVLRSQLGLEWVVACVGRAGVVGRSEPVDGTFGWRAVEVAFTVPLQDCPGQWLRLINPVPAGAAQRVSGELWLDDAKITPQA
jgi:tetratricopeptide (TPR) repeat protein